MTDDFSWAALVSGGMAASESQVHICVVPVKAECASEESWSRSQGMGSEQSERPQ